jgi:hypothetical protein
MAACDEVEANEDFLAKAINVWKRAQILFLGPAWNCQPEARYVAELLRDRVDLEMKLIELLKHESQLVSAYSLVVLDLMDSQELGQLPEGLLGRKEKITTHMGSFSDKMELGAYARQIQKRWRDRHLRMSDSE